MLRKKSSYTVLARRLADYERRLSALENDVASKPWKRNILIPSPAVYARAPEEPFMQYSTCSALDFLHPRFSEISRLLNIPISYHRKYWEWVFIVNTAMRRGLLQSPTIALGFGVGATEPISAAFAGFGVSVTATDAPQEIGIGQGWLKGGEYATGVESLMYDGIVDRDTFLEHVRYDECDMNDIPSHFRGYDFVWSSCCFEHLGDIDKGLDFVVNSVERTLKVGGVACHTTEFNLSSDDRTIESGPTVLFRKSDLMSLIERLRDRGHLLRDFVVAPDTHHLDGYVDTPPYSEPPHLRLELEGFASTSAALVIERGR